MADGKTEELGKYQKYLSVTDVTERGALAEEYFHRQALGWTASSTAGAMTYSLPLTASDSVNITGVTTYTGTFTVSGAAAFTGAQSGVRGTYAAISGAGDAADSTLTSANSGNTYFITNTGDTTAITVTLPATAAGVKYTFIRATATTVADIRIDPAAADKIQGKGITAADASAYVSEGSADAVGDLITIVGDGTDGWFVIDERGTWARET